MQRAQPRGGDGGVREAAAAPPAVATLAAAAAAAEPAAVTTSSDGADALFALPDALLHRTLALVDSDDLARLQQLSKPWRARVAALAQPRLVALRLMRVAMRTALAADGALPSIICQLDKYGEGRGQALASAQLVCKAWYDAVSDAPGVKRTYSEVDASLAAQAALLAVFNKPAEAHVPRTRVTSWLR
jgi:hypothetical protein